VIITSTVAVTVLIVGMYYVMLHLFYVPFPGAFFRG